jgi:hypothetical protein
LNAGPSEERALAREPFLLRYGLNTYSSSSPSGSVKNTA